MSDTDSAWTTIGYGALFLFMWIMAPRGRPVTVHLTPRIVGFAGVATILGGAVLALRSDGGGSILETWLETQLDQLRTLTAGFMIVYGAGLCVQAMESMAQMRSPGESSNSPLTHHSEV